MSAVYAFSVPPADRLSSAAEIKLVMANTFSSSNLPAMTCKPTGISVLSLRPWSVTGTRVVSRHQPKSRSCSPLMQLTVLLELLTKILVAARRFPIRQLILPFDEGHREGCRAEIKYRSQYCIRVWKVITEVPGRFSQDGLDQGVKQSTSYGGLRSLLPLPEVTDLVLLAPILHGPSMRSRMR